MNAPKAAKPDKPGKGYELRSINIRTAENGFIGSCSYIKTETRKGEACCNWEPDKEYVLTDRAAVIRFVDGILGMGGEQSGEKKQPPRRFGNTY